MSKVLNVLASVYACGPEWGSEVGMGWNWVRSLSKQCRLTVITESGFRESIERAGTAPFEGGYVPEFHYIDIGPTARDYFWRQGAWRFYPHYRRWQEQAFELAEKLLMEKEFDLVHQLNMVGYREPGYLWRLPMEIPLVWGPFSGFNNPPKTFYPSLGMRSGTKCMLKNIINLVQRRYMQRVQNMLGRANALVAATPADRRIVSMLCGRSSMLIPETGVSQLSPSVHAPEKTLKVAWCGVFEARKALDLGLRALAELKRRNVKIKLTIIGSGGLEKSWRNLARRLGVDKMCEWTGKVDHDTCLDIMAKQDIFMFTSWLEASSTVVMEALSLGLPVVCHDACGMAAAVTGKCGIKIPIEKPDVSVSGFANALENLANSPEKVKELSVGAAERATELTYENAAARMVKLYQVVLEDKR
ncbi:MAG: glycosyltransferase family 4 protein [Victivallaceae bacterium]|nr:glycosyltransferase family 4 protein [Victivallaceae bacterium]